MVAPRHVRTDKNSSLRIMSILWDKDSMLGHRLPTSRLQSNQDEVGAKASKNATRFLCCFQVTLFLIQCWLDCYKPLAIFQGFWHSQFKRIFYCSCGWMWILELLTLTFLPMSSSKIFFFNNRNYLQNIRTIM